MAIQSRLSVLMGERRYNIQAVLDKTGLDRTTVSNLYHDKVKRIDCKPNDILSHIKEE